MAALEQALTNPQASWEAQKRFRALQMSNTESFVQFRTRFLLLAHEAHVRPEDYRNELWHKVTPSLGLVVAALEPQIVTYKQLADCLLATDSNIRWLSPKAAVLTSTARRERNRTSQFVPAAAAAAPLTLEKPYGRTSASPSSSKLLPTVVRRSTTPTINPDHVNNTYFNYSQLSH